MTEAAIQDQNEAPTEAGVQETPTAGAPGTLQKIDEVDLLRYQKLGERVRRVELQMQLYDLQVQMYSRELQRSQGEYSEVTVEIKKLIDELQKKYNVDLKLFTVTDNGHLVPRHPEQQQLLTQNGR